MTNSETMVKWMAMVSNMDFRAATNMPRIMKILPNGKLMICSSFAPIVEFDSFDEAMKYIQEFLDDHP